MPRCLINSIRDYKRGKYRGSFVYDPFVMTTRSGLSINTVPRGGASTTAHSIVTSTRRQPSPSDQKPNSQIEKDYLPKKQSLNYLSFVTRFHLSARISELESNRLPLQFEQWKEDMFGSGRSLEVNDVIASDSEDDICIGSVDDSPCTFSQSSDEYDSADTYNSEVQPEKNCNVSECEIDVVNCSNNVSSGQCSVMNPLPIKHSVQESIIYLQANNLVCTTLGPKVRFSVVNGYARPTSASGSLDQLNQKIFSQPGSREQLGQKIFSQPGFRDQLSQKIFSQPRFREQLGQKVFSHQQPKLLTFSESNPLFLIKPNDWKISTEMQKLEERERYCKNTMHSCPVCAKDFLLKSALQSHIRRHGRNDNKCQVCGKVFSRSWLLKGHLRTHTGERPFNCPDIECDKAFADKSNLRSHMLIHSTKNKTHVCTGCGRGFAQKRYLHKHMLEVCRITVG